ncbi:MAG: hypothetical protein IKK47_05035 [Ruminococcus sp.]|nr:hypothetical protein [Ruminococcus sp.]
MKELFSKAENRIFLLLLINSSLCGVMSWLLDLSGSKLWDDFSEVSIAAKLIFGFFVIIFELLVMFVVYGLILFALLTLFFAVASRLVYRQDGSLYGAYKVLVGIDNVLFIVIAIILFIIELTCFRFQPWHALAGLLTGIIMIVSQVRIIREIRMMKNDMGNE